MATDGLAPIQEWVGRRWTDAKRVLSDFDPEFVSAVETAQSVSSRGIYVPEIKSQTQLPETWVQILGSCSEVIWTADLLSLAVEELHPDRYKDLGKPDAGRRAYYHLTNWMHHDYALHEKWTA